MVVHPSLLVIGSRAETRRMRSQPRPCAVRSLAGSPSLSFFFFPLFFLTLSGSTRPLDLDADRSRSVYNARRGARPWPPLPLPPPPIYSGRSDGRSNLGTSTNPYCATRARESRIVLGPVSLLSFFRRAPRSSALRGRGDRETSGTGGVAAMRRRKMRRRRDDGEVTEKKTEADGELSAGMRLGDQRQRGGRRVGKRPCV